MIEPARQNGSGQAPAKVRRAKKTVDPQLIRLLDELRDGEESAERWFRRLKSAFTRLDKLRGRMRRLRARIRARQEELQG